MKGKCTTWLYRSSSAIFQMMMLLWLTVSTPFVTSFQQQMNRAESRSLQVRAASGSDKEEEKSGSNPFANTTEEKTESGSSITFSEEYLHEHHEPESFLSDRLKHAKCGHSPLYIAFHGELLSPPPEA